jgi:NAD(P)-dependent dehydrogenase (short-subunit alcohol dehydrogenase family)
MAHDIPRLLSPAGRTALVTGASSGIGREVARTLASGGATVLVGVRGPGRADATAAELVAATGNPRVVGIELDLADLESVDEAARTVAERYEALDLLINNAGVMQLPQRRTTRQGVERQMGTNHLGHFALTGRLLPMLRGTGGSRVVAVSSLAHRGVRSADHDWWSADGYSPNAAYSASKAANLLFAYELERRLRADGAETISVAAHPGVAATNLTTSGPLSTASPRVQQWANAAARRLTPSAAHGARPVLLAALGADVMGGTYYGPTGPAEVFGPPGQVQPSALVQDPALAARLWKLSETLCGFTFDLRAAG